MNLLELMFDKSQKKNRQVKKGHVSSSFDDVSYGNYCFYPIDGYDLNGVAKDLVDNFVEYSKRIGKSSALFIPEDEKSYNYSLYEILRHDPWFGDVIGDPDSLPPGYIITKPSIQDFSKQNGHVFIYVAGDVINLAYHDRIELSQDIVDLCRHGENRFIERILPYSRNKLIDPEPNTTPLLKKYSIKPMVEPNLYGIGFRVISNEQNKNTGFNATEEKVYDCVVYKF